MELLTSYGDEDGYSTKNIYAYGTARRLSFRERSTGKFYYK